eukprot:529297-Rhodomonas_salina.4
MRVREEGREERSAPVLVKVGIEADTQSASRRQLMCFQGCDAEHPQQRSLWPSASRSFQLLHLCAVPSAMSVRGLACRARGNPEQKFLLTDESDPFFLYSLKISEEEFQAVKVDQSILVDFAEFPDKLGGDALLLVFCALPSLPQHGFQGASDETFCALRFMELLKCCGTAESKEHPKFTTSLVASASSVSLNIVETNQFKNLTHLRLEMRCAAPIPRPSSPLLSSPLLPRLLFRLALSHSAHT